MQNSVTFLQDTRVVGVMAILFGLLYIPAFIHGYFWLWVFPFTGIIVLFVRAMIDAVIERVAKKGDAAVQAKAMIPEFLKMNLIMTGLLSVPFVLALTLHEYAGIERLHYSDYDRSFFEGFLTYFAKEWMLADMYKSISVYDHIYIFMSNLYFIVVGGILILCGTFVHLRNLFLVLLHKGTYKYLQTRPAWGDISYIRLAVLFFLVFFVFNSSGHVLGDFGREASFVTLSTIFVFLNFFIFLTITNFVWTFVDESIR